MDHFRKGRLLRWQKYYCFNVKMSWEIRQILTPMKIQAVSVPKTKFHMTLKELEREDDEEGYFEGAYPEGSMIVMCDFTEKQLDRLLMDFRNRNVKIDYKMVMTGYKRLLGRFTRIF